MSTMRIDEDRRSSRPRTAGPARPRSFAVRPLDVQAMVHDGSPGRARMIMLWVSTEPSSVPATAYLDRDGATVLIHVSGEHALLSVAPGQYLVRTREPARWRAYDGEDFETFFAPRPREMPIFADGEVAHPEP